MDSEEDVVSVALVAAAAAAVAAVDSRRMWWRVEMEKDISRVLRSIY